MLSVLAAILTGVLGYRRAPWWTPLAAAAVVAGIALVAHTALVQPRPSWAWVDVAINTFLFHLLLMYLAFGIGWGIGRWWNGKGA